MSKEQFEEYLQKTIKEIKEEYLKFVRDEDELYLSLTIIKEKDDDDITLDYHNNYWELPSSQKLQHWEHAK